LTIFWSCPALHISELSRPTKRQVGTFRRFPTGAGRAGYAFWISKSGRPMIWNGGLGTAGKGRSRTYFVFSLCWETMCTVSHRKKGALRAPHRFGKKAKEWGALSRGSYWIPLNVIIAHELRDTTSALDTYDTPKNNLMRPSDDPSQCRCCFLDQYGPLIKALLHASVFKRLGERTCRNNQDSEKRSSDRLR